MITLAGAPLSLSLRISGGRKEGRGRRKEGGEREQRAFIFLSLSFDT